MQKQKATSPMTSTTKLYSLSLLAGSLSHLRELASLALNGHPNNSLTLLSIGLHLTLLVSLFGMARHMRLTAVAYTALTIGLFAGFPEVTSLGRLAGETPVTSLPAHIWCGYIAMDAIPILGALLYWRNLR